MRAFFAGSFDPVTNGHIDLIGRLATLMDAVVVAVSINPEKRPLFTDDERVALLTAVCEPWPNVVVRRFTGLVVDAAREVQATILVRGIRSAEEWAREVQMAQMNRALSGIETLVLPASPALTYISSSLVKEVARFGGDISPFVPAQVAERLYARLRQASTHE